jgi:hypothetical protein
MDESTVKVITVVVGAILIFAIAWLFRTQFGRQVQQAKSISLEFIGVKFQITGGDARRFAAIG